MAYFKNQRGVKLSTILSLGFLVAALVGVTALTNNPLKSFAISAFARTKTWRDIGNPRARQAARAAAEEQAAAAKKKGAGGAPEGGGAILLEGGAAPAGGGGAPAGGEGIEVTGGVGGTGGESPTVLDYFERFFGSGTRGGSGSGRSGRGN